MHIILKTEYAVSFSCAVRCFGAVSDNTTRTSLIHSARGFRRSAGCSCKYTRDALPLVLAKEFLMLPAMTFYATGLSFNIRLKGVKKKCQYIASFSETWSS